MGENCWVPGCGSSRIVKGLDKFTPYIRFLCGEQKKYNLQDSYHYHPMIFHFALLLAMKSATAYDELY